MQTALENLIINAVRYTPQDGKIELKAKKDDKYGYFSVKDNGTGLTDIAYLTDGKTDDKGHMGIGLTIVNHVEEKPTFEPKTKAVKQQAAMNPVRPEYDKQVYEKAVDEFLTAALGKSHGGGMTELQKALAIHDHLVLNCQYDLTKERKYAHSEYGALVEGLAVCEGCTLAYNDLLSRVGIKAEYIRGRLKDSGDPHAWSGVTIDGKISCGCHV